MRKLYCTNAVFFFFCNNKFMDRRTLLWIDRQYGSDISVCFTKWKILIVQLLNRTYSTQQRFSPPRTVEKHNVPLSFWTTVTVDYGKMHLSWSWTVFKHHLFFPDIRQDLYDCWSLLYWFWIWRITYKCTQSFVRTLLHAKETAFANQPVEQEAILCATD